MSGRKKLHDITSTRGHDGPIALTQQMRQASAYEFEQFLATVPEEDVDKRTATELDEALNETGPSIPLEEVRRNLGLR